MATRKANAVPLKTAALEAAIARELTETVLIIGAYCVCVAMLPLFSVLCLLLQGNVLSVVEAYALATAVAMFTGFHVRGYIDARMHQRA